MNFTNKEINKEDLLLYIISIAILFFVGWYLNNSQNLVLSAIKFNSEYIDSENLKILEATKMRYEFAGKILISNSTRTNLSFFIGSIMCLLGTLLVIRKARTDTIEASGGNSKDHNFSIKTTSPGIFLATLGTIILVFTIIIKDNYTITDNDFHVRQQNSKQIENENKKQGPPSGHSVFQRE